jgi:hypothetical protein
METGGCLTEDEVLARLDHQQMAGWAAYFQVKEERRIKELKAIHGIKG